MTTISAIVDRETLMVLLNLERAFIDTWIKGGSGDIPQMPHLPALTRGLRFHVPSVEAWLLEYFQVGGVKPGARGAAAA